MALLKRLVPAFLLWILAAMAVMADTDVGVDEEEVQQQQQNTTTSSGTTTELIIALKQVKMSSNATQGVTTESPTTASAGRDYPDNSTAVGEGVSVTPQPILFQQIPKTSDLLLNGSQR